MAFAELLAHPEVVEEMVLGSRVGFLALHGGLEPGTAEIVRDAARRSGASWYAVVQPDHLKRHVPSVHVDPGSSRLLSDFLDHVAVLVSVHGYWGHGPRPSVLVGGAGRALAARVAAALRPALPDYAIVDDLDAIPPKLRGLDPRNPVNAVAGGGVQLELPHPVRAVGPYGYGDQGDVYRAHTEALVGALADYAARAADGA